MPPGRRPARDRARRVTRGRAFSALRYPNFRRFWVAALVSNTGNWMQNVTVPFVLFTITRSAVWVGLATFLQFAPFVLVGPLAGSLADHVSRRRILITTHCILAANTSVLWVTWVAGLRSPVLIVALLGIQGLVAGLFAPSWQALVTELVPRPFLLNAITLNSAQFNASRAFGPALGGVVLATLGPSWAFLLNAASYLAVIGGLLRIRMKTAHAPAPAVEGTGVARQFIDTIRYIRGNRGISACVLVVVGLGLLTSPLFSLLVVFAEEVFHVGRGLYGLLGASIGIGAVVATPYISSRDPNRRRGPFVATVVAVHALAAVAFALAPAYWLAVAALLVMGASYLGVAANLNTTVQLLVEDARRGRVISLYLMGLTAALPVGALIQGWLVEAVGPRPTVAGAGLLLVAATAWLGTRGWLAAIDDQPQASVVAPAALAASQPSASGHQRQAGPGR